MDVSLAGLIGSALAIVAGMASYFLTVPFIEKRLRELSKQADQLPRHVRGRMDCH